MRFQVPQFVDIEDKIIGPLTLKQFLIYLAAVLLMIPLFIAFDITLFVTVALPMIGIAVAFAHVRIHSKSLASVIGNATKYTTRGQLFLWQRTAQPKPLRIQGEEYGNFSPEEALSTSDTSVSLATRAQVLETQGRIVQEDAEDPLLAETK